MDGQDLINFVKESKSEKMTVFLRTGKGALKRAEFFVVKPVVYSDEKQELIIVIE